MGNPVILYATSWCGHCRRLKRALDAEGIAWEEIDIDRAEHRHFGDRIVAETGGYRTVPTVEIGAHLLVNPTAQEVKAALLAG